MEIGPVIPNSVYYVMGALILTNIGTIISLAVIAFRATWWLSKADSRINEAHAVGVRAHRRIDKIEEN